MNNTLSFKPLEIAALALLGAVMLFQFAVTLPHLDSDRESENYYLQIPYTRVAMQSLKVWQTDPFAENSPLLMYTLAELTYHTKGLLTLRYTQFIFVLFDAFLIFALFKQYANLQSWPPYALFFFILTMFMTWSVIPGIMIYFVQTNGMAAGVASLLIGLLLVDEHPNWAMFAFGTAYQFKGQFLALLPAMIAYWLLLDEKVDSMSQRIKRVGVLVATFLIPSMVISSLILASFGWFHTGSAFFHYVMNPIKIFKDEATRFCGLFIFHAPTESHTITTRRIEFNGFGLTTKALITLSIGTCLIWLIQAFRQRIYPNERCGTPRALRFFGTVGLFYWLHYFFFWNFPFWYNTFVVIPLNMFIFPYWIYHFGEFIRERTNELTFRNALIAVSILLTLTTGVLSYRRWEIIVRSERGNNLNPYSWMRT